MPRRTAVPVEEAKLALLAALRRGAPVVEAARGAGAALWTFYRWRKRDPVFDSAWTMAMEASLWSEPEGADGRRERRRTKRRVRFGPAARSAFLERLAGHCDSESAARDTGFHPCTVRRHAARDRGFERDHAAALRRGYARLERWAAEARAAQTERLRSRLGDRPAPGVRGLDHDTLDRRMRRWARPDGSIGPRRVRRPGARSTWTFARAIALLDRRLDGLGIRRRPPAGPGEG